MADKKPETLNFAGTLLENPLAGRRDSLSLGKTCATQPTAYGAHQGSTNRVPASS